LQIDKLEAAVKDLKSELSTSQMIGRQAANKVCKLNVVSPYLLDINMY